MIKPNAKWDENPILNWRLLVEAIQTSPKTQRQGKALEDGTQLYKECHIHGKAKAKCKSLLHSALQKQSVFPQQIVFRTWV